MLTEGTDLTPPWSSPYRHSCGQRTVRPRPPGPAPFGRPGRRSSPTSGFRAWHSPQAGRRTIRRTSPARFPGADSRQPAGLFTFGRAHLGSRSCSHTKSRGDAFEAAGADGDYGGAGIAQRGTDPEDCRRGAFVGRGEDCGDGRARGAAESAAPAEPAVPRGDAGHGRVRV
jgi:hypothetical protein